jgi:hypothetical protein
MAFDTSTRNRLAKFVGEARRLLTDEFIEQLQSLYGISATGSITPIERLGHLDAEGRELAGTLRQRIAYLVSSHADARDATEAAVARLTREQAFTIVNRLAAIRMAETRGLIVESVGQQYQSKGFKVFESVAGSAIGETFDRYRCYLFCLFDELAIDLGVLFDRKSPQAMLFPREPALLALLDLLDAPDLQPLWAEDETIGWIYQYYNDEAERKKMREESASPRNSRELAVRNQFFTPRYVVEFLTDNTLGRIWYEMTRGQTSLRDCCRYLVRRPNEIFLKAGESPPENAASSAAEAGRSLSQEELLNQPVHIPHRPLKDPREIRLLDPACGSMHFGLYAFDLFTVIYDEAWEMAHSTDVAVKSAETFAPFVAFAANFADKDAFLRDVPRLIIEHNLHGIDIDPRAAQIAGLSLWLRAQRAWHKANVKTAGRPRITRSNVVCAEPMPGDKNLLREFVEQQFPPAEQPAFRFLFEKIFDRMTLAGEAGSLLRIEMEIRASIAEAKKIWDQEPHHEQKKLFSDAAENVEEIQKRLDLSGITTEEFWGRAEERIYDALSAYAEQAEEGDGLKRRLFADDAAQGFAFIDVARNRFDVVVMNPPFGGLPESAAEYCQTHFGGGRPDAYRYCFFRVAELLTERGSIGALSSRTFQSLEYFLSMRRALLIDGPRLLALADLGGGVLDGATVEASAYVAARTPTHHSAPAALFYKLEDSDDKGRALVDAMTSAASPRRYVRAHRDMASLPGGVLAYWLPPQWAALFRRYRPLDAGNALPGLTKADDSCNPTLATVCQGLIPGDTFRFTRLAWELGGDGAGKSQWASMIKGGEYSPYWSAEPWSIRWNDCGKEMKAFAEQRYGGASRTIKSEGSFFRPGLSFPNVSSVGLNVRLMPDGAILTNTGYGIIPETPVCCKSLCGFLNSQPVAVLCEAMHPGRKFDVGYVAAIPCPSFDTAQQKLIATEVDRIAVLTKSLRTPDGRFWSHTWPRDADPLAAAEGFRETYSDRLMQIREAQARINDTVFQMFELDSADQQLAKEIITASRTTEEVDARYGVYLMPNAVTDAMIVSSAPSAYELVADFVYQTLEQLYEPATAAYADDPSSPHDVVGALEMRIRDLCGESVFQQICSVISKGDVASWLSGKGYERYLKNCSLSPRAAPLLWPLSSPKGLYTLWVHYQYVTHQTLHLCLADFVDPKIRAVEAELLAHAGKATSRVTELRELLSDLGNFRDALERIAALPWRPNLNDGVLITASPLWKLFRLSKWSKDLKACWEELEKGDYDWAHLAYTIWPARVEKVCESDRSVAIAHGLEHLCKVEPPKPKKPRGKKASS